jgi:hypothetical protein
MPHRIQIIRMALTAATPQSAMAIILITFTMVTYITLMRAIMTNTPLK